MNKAWEKKTAGEALDSLVAYWVFGEKGETPPRYSRRLTDASRIAFHQTDKLPLGVTCHVDEESKSDLDDSQPSMWWCGPLPMPTVADDAGLKEWEARGAMRHRSVCVAMCRAALRFMRERRLAPGARPTKANSEIQEDK